MIRQEETNAEKLIQGRLVMLYAIDADPVPQQAVYEIVPATLEHAVNGSTGIATGSSAGDSGRITDGHTHCIISSAGRKVAVCDNATLISMQNPEPGTSASPVHPVLVRYAPTQVAEAPTPVIQDAADLPSPEASSATRRWLSDLLMTFGAGFLMVSAFLFMTSRTSLPPRYRR